MDFSKSLLFWMVLVASAGPRLELLHAIPAKRSGHQLQHLHYRSLELRSNLQCHHHWQRD